MLLSRVSTEEREEMGKAKNPNVYFDVSIGGAPAERLAFEVRFFDDML
jgi:hypothetical protein